MNFSRFKPALSRAGSVSWNSSFSDCDNGTDSWCRNMKLRFHIVAFPSSLVPRPDTAAPSAAPSAGRGDRAIVAAEGAESQPRRRARRVLDKPARHLVASQNSRVSWPTWEPSMQVTINGKPEEVQAATVLDLLKAKNIDPHMVAVELNQGMVERDRLGTTPVKAGDQIEVL